MDKTKDRVKVNIKLLHCYRCKYEWFPNTRMKDGKPVISNPKVCPKCKSRHWNQPSAKDLLKD